MLLQFILFFNNNLMDLRILPLLVFLNVNVHLWWLRLLGFRLLSLYWFPHYSIYVFWSYKTVLLVLVKPHRQFVLCNLEIHDSRLFSYCLLTVLLCNLHLLENPYMLLFHLLLLLVYFPLVLLYLFLYDSLKLLQLVILFFRNMNLFLCILALAIRNREELICMFSMAFRS